MMVQFGLSVASAAGAAVSIRLTPTPAATRAAQATIATTESTEVG